MTWFSRAASWFGARSRGAGKSTEVRIVLTTGKTAWVGYSKEPPPGRLISDVSALCALYAPKMIYNAQRCPDAERLLRDIAVLLEGEERSGLDKPARLAGHLLGDGEWSLLEESPPWSQVRGDVIAQLYRNVQGTPIIQTHFPETIGPGECVASIRFLWAWATLQLGNAGLSQLWYAMGIVPYYHQEHAAEQGRYWDLEGFMASCSYIIHMLASYNALEAAGEAETGSEGAFDRISQIVREARDERKR